MNQGFHLDERLAPYLKVLPDQGSGRRIRRFKLSGATLFVSDIHDTNRIARHALSLMHGQAGGAWHIERGPEGRPYAMRGEVRTDAISATRVNTFAAVAVAWAGPIGLDAETVERVSQHTDSGDFWLSKAERRALGRALPAEQPIELTCRWVLKEAYGKALGVGVGYDLGSVSFAGGRDRIVARGDAASRPALRCSFALYLMGRHVLALARPHDDEAKMPLAPFGKKPPACPVDSDRALRI